MDNVIVNQPTSTGATIATEDVAGVQHQKVLVEFSDGAGGVVLVADGDGLPVNDSGTQSQLTNVANQLASILTKIIAAPSTEVKQDALNSLITTLNSIVATSAKQDTGNTSLSSIDGKITAVNTGAVVVSSSALPSGASTGAKQDTGNTSLSSIDGKLGSLGQKAMAGSAPVVIASDQSAIPISGSVTTGGLTDTQLRATPVPVSMSADIEIGAVELKNGTDDTRATVTAANALKVDGSAVTQPVSAVALPLPSGAATSALQTQPGVDIGDVTINNAAGASSVNIQDGGNSITIDASSLPLPTGAATSAKQDTGNTSVASIDTKTPALGQALAAASTPVVLTAAEEATLAALLTISDFDSKTGSLTETAPATDTASSGLNGRLQRIAQRLTSLITALGSPFQAGGSIGNTSFIATQATAANLNVTEASAAAILAKVTAAAASMVKLEDAASADGDAGVPSMAIRKGTPANTSGTDGDYEMLQMSAGRLWASATIDSALPAGANAIGKLAANDGVDIGDVTINNAAGASAVNIQDGGNSITVDGTVTITPSGTQTVAGNKTNNNAAPGATNIGVLPAVANAAAPTQVEGNQVALRSTLTGDLAITLDGESVAVTNAGLTNIDVALSTRNLEATQLLVKAKTDNLDVALSTRLKPADTLAGITTVAAVTAITNALPAGSNLLGKVGIDQTTPGTTNKVTLGADVVHTIVDSATTLPLPSGAATSANQATEIASLASIDAGIPAALGAATIANSMPVNIASDQTINAAITSVIPGIGSTNLGKAEDSAFTDGDVGVMNLGVREDVPSTTTNSNGDYVAMKTDNNGRLWVNSDVLASIQNKNVGLLERILTEMRIQTAFLAQGLNVTDNPENYRNDPYVVNMY